ncbi:MAG TPA: response regulator, partial [Nitrospira sp.]|nr:response regulator [Nitrospira sp.]
MNRPRAISLKLLLVDDNERNLMALSEALRREDVDVLCAKSGLEALELLLTHGVALAIIDVQMPEMDGFELAELMRGAERAKHVPIIFVTAGSRDAERRFRGYEAGAVDFLYKPIEPAVLKSKVAVFLELDRQRRELVRLLEERTEAERRARESEAQLQYALKATNDVVWDWDVS